MKLIVVLLTRKHEILEAIFLNLVGQPTDPQINVMQTSGSVTKPESPNWTPGDLPFVTGSLRCVLDLRKHGVNDRSWPARVGRRCGPVRHFLWSCRRTTLTIFNWKGLDWNAGLVCTGTVAGFQLELVAVLDWNTQQRCCINCRRGATTPHSWLRVAPRTWQRCTGRTHLRHGRRPADQACSGSPGHWVHGRSI